VRDRNLRIHLAAGVLAGAFVAVAPLAAAERAVILLCVALVISAEAANTAIEAIVDLVSPGWNERARIAKDAAAAAVLALAAGSVLALAAIVAARWDELVAAAPRLADAASSAVVIALAAGVLPWRGRRAAGTPLDGLVGVAAVALAIPLARQASSPAGVAAVLLCLSVSISAAFRKRRVAPPG
jgi:diacylglycerol kinase (ATP)